MLPTSEARLVADRSLICYDLEHSYRPLEREMVDEPENMVLRYLRQIDQKVDRVIAEVNELKTRVGRLVTSVAQIHVHLAELSVRMDKIDGRLDRIERRLTLVDAEA
jgi:tetrahydromethanopterin S-methyltransferase subunit G